MTDKFKFTDLPESVQLMFNATFAENKDKETLDDNEAIRRKRARAEELKNLKTYGVDEDVF